MKRLIILGALVLNEVGAVSAVCNNPGNWLESPGEGVKTFVGYRQELPYGFATQMNGGLPGFAVNPDLPYPPPLPAEMLTKPWEGKLSAMEPSFISYYEPDGKGAWRVCRIEKWAPKPEDSRLRREWQFVSNEATHKRNPVVRPWLKTHFTWTGIAYLYDTRGRISETFFVQPQENSGDDPTGERECFRFDDKDRPELYVRANHSNRCPTGDEPDPRDFSERFKFMTLKDGSVTDTWLEQHFGQADGSWGKDVSFHMPLDLDNPDEDKWFQSGNARVESGKGVVKILGGHRLGERDESLGSTYKVNDHVQPSEYFFTKPPVPISILEAPEKIYDYDRRRETSVDGVIKLIEFFPAGRHRVRDRFYMAMGRTLRHEQLDEGGKLKRAINLGNFSRQDMETGFYDEDLKHAGIDRKLKGHEVYYRVWEYDAAGKGRLVALGWNAKFRPGKTEKIDEAEIVFGTPDGAVKWKTQQEFFKAFDFDPHADRAYPETRR